MSTLRYARNGPAGALGTGRGLGEILRVLGRSADVRARSGLVTLFLLTTLVAAGAAQVGQLVFSLPAAPTQAALWLAWLSWHSVLFPRARRRALRHSPAAAYRAVFLTHILPGVCIGVSLMGGPALQALLAGAPLAHHGRLALAAVWLAGGTALLVGAFASIGVASAGFLYEYIDALEPITARGVYRFVRHPLFLGGVISSIGAALAFDTTLGIAGAAINLAVLPAYKLLEDRRLSDVFGHSYRAYRGDVAAFVPSLRTLRAATRG